MFQTDKELKHHSPCIFLTSSSLFFPPSPSSPYPLFVALCIREYWLNRSFIDDGLQRERESGASTHPPGNGAPCRGAAVTTPLALLHAETSFRNSNKRTRARRGFTRRSKNRFLFRCHVQIWQGDISVIHIEVNGAV